MRSSTCSLLGGRRRRAGCSLGRPAQGASWPCKPSRTRARRRRIGPAGAAPENLSPLAGTLPGRWRRGTRSGTGPTAPLTGQVNRRIIVHVWHPGRHFEIGCCGPLRVYDVKFLISVSFEAVGGICTSLSLKLKCDRYQVSVWVRLTRTSAVLDSRSGVYLMGAGVKWRDHSSARELLSPSTCHRNISFLPEH